MRRLFLTTICFALVAHAFTPTVGNARSYPSQHKTVAPPAVISLSIIKASQAASIIRAVFPDAQVRIDEPANAVIVAATPDEMNSVRSVITGVDVKDPTSTTVDTDQVQHVRPDEVATRLRDLFPDARFSVAPNRTLIISAKPNDLTEIKSVISTIDTPPPTPSPRPEYPAEAVRVTDANPRAVARTVARSVLNVRVAVSGPQVLLSGAPDDVAHAKALIAELDVPQPGTQFTNVYRLRYVDANSVADLLRRSFRNISLQVDTDLNAITVYATETVQRRIADALDQLDVSPNGSGSANNGGAGGGGSTDTDVITLNAALPGLNGSPSTSANDIAQTVTQALASEASDLKITVPPNSTQLILAGSQYSIKLAKDLIDKLDQPLPLVVLDTEVLEVNDAVAKNLGLQYSNSMTTTFQEVPPPAPTGAATAPPLMGIQPFGRTTPLSFSVTLNAAINNNQARVLSDPRITTVSGRTASVRAGDQISVLTTSGGSGVPTTTQLQTFQTGVTLDITPIVNSNNYITITLHPSVNSLSGYNNGVPQISTRDTTTTVGLQDDQTLVIGGLIQDTDTVVIDKVPVLGDIPLVGKLLFQNKQINKEHDQVIVTVTPHIVRMGEHNVMPGPPLPAIPSPEPLPTLAPGTTLPPPSPIHHDKVARIPVPAPEPTPVSVWTQLPRATSGTGSTVSTPAPTPSPSNAPQPLPTAFGQTNVYTYGAAPANNYAQANQALQIFYVQVQPTVVQNGTPITISAITTTNVDKLTFGPTALLSQVSLSKIGPGQWRSTFNFSTAGLPMNAGNVQLLLSATSNLGGNASLPIPLSLMSP